MSVDVQTNKLNEFYGKIRYKVFRASYLFYQQVKETF